MKVLIINGPNLNMLGRREPDLYGTQPFEPYLKVLTDMFPRLELRYMQSNSEGVIIDALQQALMGPDSLRADGVVLNAAAYTHYSYAIADAIRAIAPLPVIEVHLSNTAAREDFRSKSVIAPACKGSISGFGLHSYELAIRGLLSGCNDN